MKANLNINIDNFFFRVILFLIFVKLIFSYLLIELSYFQRHLIPNVEKYNFLAIPANFSTQIEFVLLPLLIIFILRNFKYSGKLNIIFNLSLVMYGINIATGILNGISLLNSINHSLKLFTPVYFFLALYIQHQKIRFDLKNNMINFIKVCFVLALIGLILFDSSFNRGAFYLPIYFSGSHTHSYILVFCFIGLGYLLYRRGYRQWMIILLFSSFAFLLFGYNIRTALLCYLIFILVMLYLSHDLFKLVIIKGIVFLFPVFLLLIFLKSNLDFDQISSGRLSMYAAKFDQLKDNNLTEWLFGRGFGSDLILIDVWWWGQKGAHSDLITYLIENGSIYLIFFFILILTLLILPGKLNVIYCSLIIGYFLSATISNGITSRPLVAYMFFVLLAYVYADITNDTKSIL